MTSLEFREQTEGKHSTESNYVQRQLFVELAYYACEVVAKLAKVRLMALNCLVLYDIACNRNFPA
jgi:hypothetical protein